MDFVHLVFGAQLVPVTLSDIPADMKHGRIVRPGVDFHLMWILGIMLYLCLGMQRNQGLQCSVDVRWEVTVHSIISNIEAVD